MRSAWSTLTVVAALVIGAAGCSAAADDPSPPDATQTPTVDPGEPDESVGTDDDESPEPDDDESADANDDPSGSSPTTPPAPGPTEAAPLPTVTADIDEEVELSTGMAVSLESVTATEVTAETPGEVSGPAVVVVVDLTNTSDEVQSIDSAVVNLTTADGEVGISTTAGDPSHLSGELAPDESAEATYVFMLDPADRREVTVSVNYSAGEPVAEFTGHTS